MRILSVDDNPQNLRLLEKLLEKAGHEVVSASHGREALSALRRESFDLIVSDILMPQMDGFQFCRQVKQDPVLQHIPLVFFSASYTEPEDRDLAASLGASGFVPKPAPTEVLLEAINRAVQEKVPPAKTSASADDEERYLRFHNERLVHKLEQKVGELSELSARLQSELDQRNRETAARARAEAILRETETRYRIVAEQTGVLIYDYHIASGRVAWHGAVTRLTGWAPEEFQAVDISAWEEMIHPEDRPRTLGDREVVMQSARDYAMEYRFRRKDGSYVQVEDRGAFLRGEQGDIVRILGAMMDVTTRVKAEQSLRDSEALHHSLVEHLPLALFVKGPDRKYSYVNQRFCDLTGASPDGTVGGTDRDLFAPVRAAEYEAGDDVVFRTGSLFQAEETFRRPDGQDVTVQVIKSPVRNAWGHVVAVQGILRDVTEERRAEVARREHEIQLRQVQKMEALGSLAGGIAHDFNNILASILLNVDLLKGSEDAGPAVRGALGEIERASMRARDVVRQILAFGRQQEQQRIPLHLPDVVTEVHGLLRATLPTTIELRSQIAEDCPWIQADPALMRQVLVNLVTNAAHAMGERGGGLDIALDPFAVDAAFARLHPPLREGPAVRLRVTDTGPGMDPGVRERVFEPYFSTKGLGESSGLGLSVVHGIVRNHDGAIVVESELGKGSSFQVYLPAMEQAAAGRASATSAPARGNGERVLLVDDEESVARAGSTMLRRLGYQPFAYIDPREALEALQQAPQRFDVVISDLTMPHLTGAALARAVQELRPDLPVILTTGYLGTVNASHLKQAGILEVMSKPFRAQELAACIARALKPHG